MKKIEYLNGAVIEISDYVANILLTTHPEKYKIHSLSTVNTHNYISFPAKIKEEDKEKLH